MGLLQTLSTINAQSKLRVRLVLEVLAKLIVWDNLCWNYPKVGASYNRSVSFMRQEMVSVSCMRGQVNSLSSVIHV